MKFLSLKLGREGALARKRWYSEGILALIPSPPSFRLTYFIKGFGKHWVGFIEVVIKATGKWESIEAIFPRIVTGHLRYSY